MIDKLIKISEKGILAFFALYSYNLLAQNFNLIIPINMITVLVVTIFDLLGLLGLIFLYLLIF